MLTLFKKVEVINKKIKTPDYSFINGDYFSDENNWIELFNKEKDICILIEDNIEYLNCSCHFTYIIRCWLSCIC